MVLPLVNFLVLLWLYMIWPVENNGKNNTARFFVFTAIVFDVVCFYQYLICYYPDWIVRFGIVL
jgi:hypothetical protein